MLGERLTEIGEREEGRLGDFYFVTDKAVYCVTSATITPISALPTGTTPVETPQELLGHTVVDMRAAKPGTLIVFDNGSGAFVTMEWSPLTEQCYQVVFFFLPEELHDQFENYPANMPKRLVTTPTNSPPSQPNSPPPPSKP